MRYVWTFVGAVFDGQRDDDVVKFPWNAVFQSFQSGIWYINRIKITMLNTLDCYTKHLPTNYVAPNFYPNFEWWPGDDNKPQLILAWLFCTCHLFQLQKLHLVLVKDTPWNSLYRFVSGVLDLVLLSLQGGFRQKFGFLPHNVNRSNHLERHQRVEQEVAQLRGYICSNMPKAAVFSIDLPRGVGGSLCQVMDVTQSFRWLLPFLSIMVEWEMTLNEIN